MPPSSSTDRQQAKELAVFAGLYGLSNLNAEMLRRAVGADSKLQASPSLVADSARLISDHLHPLMMAIGAVWLLCLAVAIVRKRTLPRWAFDAAGLWFCVRLVLEFLIVNGLIFQPALVQPGVLLGQIVVYLPFFVLNWGWIFYRLDWLHPIQPGSVIRLSDIDPERGLSRFDYFHSTVNTLINKGKSTITGVSRTGRITALIFNGMLLSLYAVAFARILQLTKATL
jgi:hypothetical protein